VFLEIYLCSKTFCGAEGLENVINLSDFNSGDFGKKNGLEILMVHWLAYIKSTYCG
jgi:peroxiredoxin